VRLRRQERVGRLDGEAQAATGGGEDGEGACLQPLPPRPRRSLCDGDCRKRADDSEKASSGGRARKNPRGIAGPVIYKAGDQQLTGGRWRFPYWAASAGRLQEFVWEYFKCWIRFQL
jgi:hypothetical protein